MDFFEAREALYLCGCPLVDGLVGWLVGCNAGYSSDVTLAFEDTQVIPPFSRKKTDGTCATDHTDHTADTDHTDDRDDTDNAVDTGW